MHPSVKNIIEDVLIDMGYKVEGKAKRVKLKVKR